jgi:hypothetical protein
MVVRFDLHEDLDGRRELPNVNAAMEKVDLRFKVPRPEVPLNEANWVDVDEAGVEVDELAGAVRREHRMGSSLSRQLFYAVGENVDTVGGGEVPVFAL